MVRKMKNILDLFPGSTAANLILITLGIVFAVISTKYDPNSTATLIAGFGAALFIAGFIGLINLRVLSKEIGSMTREPFEDISTIVPST